MYGSCTPKLFKFEGPHVLTMDLIGRETTSNSAQQGLYYAYFDIQVCFVPNAVHSADVSSRVGMFPHRWPIGYPGDSPEAEIAPWHAPEKGTAESDSKKLPHGKRLF